VSAVQTPGRTGQPDLPTEAPAVPASAARPAECRVNDCAYPATGKGDYAWACWRHTPDADNYFPVLVTYTQQHVVWVAATDPAAAADALGVAPYEVTNDNETLSEAFWSVDAPQDRYDWDHIQDGSYAHPYQGTEADAHVRAWRDEQYRRDRAAKTAACAEAGHPDATADRIGRYCPVCWRLPDQEPADA
jgi:hypothetical protein